MNSSGWNKVFVGLAGFVLVGFCQAAVGRTLVDCNGDPNSLTTYEFYGDAELDNFGIGLDSAGDFNGDGIPDLIVGAPYSDANAQDGGAAYLFLGGPSADPNWDFRLLAEAADDQLGWAVAGVGDLDSDGFDDIALGARFNDRSGIDRGSVWVIFGSEPPFGSQQLVLSGEAAGPKAFGHALAGGDFNGDGYSDLVVAAPFDQLSNWGKVYIFFGGSPMDTVADVAFQAEGSAHEFGWSVACAGDLNGDGFDDLVVGARYYGSYLDPERGKAYIYFGGDPMDSTADLELPGENIYCWLGYSVAGAGDVDGDGFDDVLVGSPYYPGGLSSQAYGRVYLLSGGATMDNVPDVNFDGAAPHDQFGWSVDGELDLNGDDYNDIIVGARFGDCASSDGGAAYVYYGGPSMDSTPDISAGSAAADDALGTTVAMIGNWSDAMPLAATGAVWNDAGKDVNDPMQEGAYGAVFAFPAPACMAGDFNRDGSITWSDVEILDQHWLQADCSDLNWCSETDMDHDRKVAFSDLALLAERWLQQCN